MKTMQNEQATINQSNENKIISHPLPDITKTEFFYGECKQFSNDELGITCDFDARSGRLEVNLSFKKGEFLSFVELADSRRQIGFLKQPHSDCPLPFKSSNLCRKQINSNEDIPADCKDLCHFDKENEILTILMFVPHDYALDYGTYPKSNCIYLQFMTGHRWRFLDRVTGG